MPEADSDASADTARFQAFAARQEEDIAAPWQDQAPRSSRTGLLIAVVAAAAIVAAVIVVSLFG